MLNYKHKYLYLKYPHSYYNSLYLLIDICLFFKNILLP